MVLLNILDQFFPINKTLNSLVKNVIGTFSIEGWVYVSVLLIGLIILRLKVTILYLISKGNKLTNEYLRLSDDRKSLKTGDLDIKKKTRETESLLAEIEMFMKDSEGKRDMVTREEFEENATKLGNLKERNIAIKAEFDKEDKKLIMLESSMEQLTVEVNDFKSEAREKKFSINMLYSLLSLIIGLAIVAFFNSISSFELGIYFFSMMTIWILNLLFNGFVFIYLRITRDVASEKERKDFFISILAVLITILALFK